VRVSPSNRPRSVVLVGLVTYAFGVILRSQFGRVLVMVLHTRVKWAVLTTVYWLSAAAILGGLLAALVGACIWARRAPVSRVLSVAAAIAIMAVLPDRFGEFLVHPSSGILIFVVLILLLIALTRWLRTRYPRMPLGPHC